MYPRISTFLAPKDYTTKITYLDDDDWSVRILSTVGAEMVFYVKGEERAMALAEAFAEISETPLKTYVEEEHAA